MRKKIINLIAVLSTSILLIIAYPVFNPPELNFSFISKQSLEYKDIVTSKVSLDHEIVKKISDYSYIFIAGTLFLLLNFKSDRQELLLIFFISSLLVIAFSGKLILDTLDYAQAVSHWLMFDLGNPQKIPYKYWNNIVFGFRYTLLIALVNTAFFYVNNLFLYNNQN